MFFFEMFIPILGEMIQIDEHIFKQPPPRFFRQGNKDDKNILLDDIFSAPEKMGAKKKKQIE